MYKIHKITSYGQETTSILRLNEDGSITSFGEYPDNPDYQAYLKWLEEGGQPLPPDEGE